jgi:hypothetical protein
VFDEVAKLNYRDLKTIEEKINECSSPKDFYKKYRNEYEYLKLSKKLNLLDPIRSRPESVTDEEIIKACLQFNCITSMRKGNKKMYDLCKKRKLIKDVSKHLIRNGGSYKHFTQEQLIKAAEEMFVRRKLSDPIKRELTERGLLNLFERGH